MKKSLVRCWKMTNYASEWKDEICITYPEDNTGHRLITCLNCGMVYSVSVSKMVYIGPPLEQKLTQCSCSRCGKRLAETYGFYPDTYLSHGTVITFERPIRIPPPEESVVEEFEEIY
jgi:hypothetical protein